MSYTKINVTKPTGMPGVGGGMKSNITVFDFDDVTGGYARDASGINTPGNLVFKAGAYAITIAATSSTIKAGSEVSGDEDAEGIIQNVEFNHPGDSVAIREFLYNWLGRNVGIIIEKCKDGSKKLYGTPCAPLKLSYKEDIDKAKNGATITFKSSQVGPPISEYLGTITYDAVKDTAAADATTVDVAAGSGEYQLTSGTAAPANITTLSNPVDGAVYCLLGSGGAHPSTIDDGDDFILAVGATWTAISGSKLTVKAFKDGAASFKFIEVSRQ